jgi:stage II sporulation protein D
MGLLLKLLKRQMYIIFILGITILMPPSGVQGAYIVTPPTSLRVALALDMASAEFAVSEGNYELVDYMTQRVISPVPGSGSWVVAPAGNAGIQISNNGQPVGGLASSLVILRQKNPAEQNIFRFKNKRYRGDLLIENLNGKLQMINLIDVEQYLYGVVGAEIGMTAPDEALKAQAIVSRTYALYYKERPQLHYDLGTTTLWQVYGGYDTEVLSGERVKKAVDETRGIVIYYDNSLIQAFFHANSGGYTESAENVWYANIPYIKPVAAPEDAHALQVPQQAGWPAVTYQWEKTFTRQELLDQIKRWNSEHPDNQVNVGEILDFSASRQAINPVTREYLPYETASKRVTQFDIIGQKGVKSFFRDQIRSVLGLKSTLFTISLDSTVDIWTAFGTLDTFNMTKDLLATNVDGMVSKLNGNNGNYYVISAEGVKTVPKVFTNVKISGKGHGHGLGMSQWGARGMAAAGDNHKKILEHYYNQDRNDGRLTLKIYQPVLK